MKNELIVFAIFCSVLIVHHSQANQPSGRIDNTLIDFDGYMMEVVRVAKVRESHRVGVQEFLQMTKEPTTIILDARSADKYAMKHLKGAKHLSYTDFTQGSLAQVIPSKDTRILIYCNNNFRDNSIVFTTKVAPAALNISTMVSLSSYGYHNVYELGPALYENDRRLTFETSL